MLTSGNQIILFPVCFCDSANLPNLTRHKPKDLKWPDDFWFGIKIWTLNTSDSVTGHLHVASIFPISAHQASSLQVSFLFCNKLLNMQASETELSFPQNICKKDQSPAQHFVKQWLERFLCTTVDKKKKIPALR